MKNKADKQTVVHISQNEKTKSASRTRKEKNRKKDAVIAIGVIFVLIVCIVIAGVALLKVGTVEVTDNNGRYTDDRITEIAGISGDSSLLLLNAEKIEQTVCLALPYIQSITLVRTLPDHVQLQVTYAEAAFAVNCGQVWLILSEDGKVLETTQVVPSDMTELKGVPVTEYAIGRPAVFENELYFTHAANVLKACNENQLKGIRTLQIDQSGYVFVNIANQFYVQSGSVHVLLEEMAVLKRVIQEREEKKTSFTFTIAADGSITISSRETTEQDETDVPFDDPYLNMDSELVGNDEKTDHSELVGDDDLQTDLLSPETNEPTEATTSAQDGNALG